MPSAYPDEEHQYASMAMELGNHPPVGAFGDQKRGGAMNCQGGCTAARLLAAWEPGDPCAALVPFPSRTVDHQG